MVAIDQSSIQLFLDIARVIVPSIAANAIITSHRKQHSNNVVLIVLPYAIFALVLLFEVYARVVHLLVLQSVVSQKRIQSKLLMVFLNCFELFKKHL